MLDLIGWKQAVFDRPVTWRPRALDHGHWPPDYQAIWRWRMDMIVKLMASPSALRAAKAYYSTRPAEFIMDWMDTYDPRKTPTHENPELRGPKWMPFVFFLKQRDFIDFLHDLRAKQENGLVEKSRDMGATWASVGYSVWSWLFIPDDSIGWGSRKEDLVDMLGNPDSIFEKMRLILDRIPKFWLPEDFSFKKHATYMRLVNPENGSTIMGEAGNNIGRGGRKAMYFKDEAAHYEHPEMIEAALGDNTNVQIDISSVNGLGNVFHRRRENGMIWERDKDMPRGITRVFIMDWTDHPNKTQAWYDARRAKFEREGMAHIFAQEVDRNYSAAVSNTIIDAKWIRAAVDAHLKIPYVKAQIDREGIPDVWMGGLDIADEGIDRNALTLRQWIIWRHCEEWGERDPGVTARRAMRTCREYANIRVQYDAVGLGSNVKSEYNRLVLDEKIEGIPVFIPWNAGAGVMEPYGRIIPDDDESALNRDFYGNLKAQAWWSIRARFYKTYMAVTQGAVYPVEELISLDSDMPLLEQLIKELAQPTRGENGQLKTIVNKKPEGTKSPNLADGGIMMFFPMPEDYATVETGTYG